MPGFGLRRELELYNTRRRHTDISSQAHSLEEKHSRSRLRSAMSSISVSEGSVHPGSSLSPPRVIPPPVFSEIPERPPPVDPEPDPSSLLYLEARQNLMELRAAPPPGLGMMISGPMPHSHGPPALPLPPSVAPNSAVLATHSHTLPVARSSREPASGTHSLQCCCLA